MDNKTLCYHLQVKSLWWRDWGYVKGARAVTIGHVVLLGPRIEYKDLEHELIHVQQHQRIFVFKCYICYTAFMSKAIIEEQKINRLVKKTVAEALRDILRDPDFGLELQEWVKNRISKKPTKTISLAGLRKKYS